MVNPDMERVISMYKAGVTGFATLMLCLSLAGCQGLLKSVKGIAVTSDTAAYSQLSAAKIEALKQPAPKGLPSLHCSGGLGCEFAQLNNILVVDDATKLPTAQAMTASIVRLESNILNTPSSSNGSANALQQTRYFVAMRPGKSEVKVRFYPVTLDRAENFVLIHSFQASKNYSLNMFRQHNNAASTSLLSAATPDPLCVDLLENTQLIRQFCRPFDPATGLGEFIEQKLSK